MNIQNLSRATDLHNQLTALYAMLRLIETTPSIALEIGVGTTYVDKCKNERITVSAVSGCEFTTHFINAIDATIAEIEKEVDSL